MGFSNLTGGSNEASNGAVLAETGSGTLTFLASVDHFVFLGEVVTDPFAVVEAGAQCVHLSIQISQIQANPKKYEQNIFLDHNKLCKMSEHLFLKKI